MKPARLLTVLPPTTLAAVTPITEALKNSPLSKLLPTDGLVDLLDRTRLLPGLLTRPGYQACPNELTPFCCPVGGKGAGSYPRSPLDFALVCKDLFLLTPSCCTPPVHGGTGNIFTSFILLFKPKPQYICRKAVLA
ncbi:hypothetical protein GQ602_003964 [Ophiocordyceps camponoti-floridani]|uniref:Hydrophobin n=1 Tax=Ophiocordyceps camponoti-floridani TaxID=2030778 RepID=A0A8H4VD42_9HYPO|nr:hypothetical protein GQ602_003964 [Ophiocordyceps camponoti-floridani]